MGEKKEMEKENNGFNPANDSFEYGLVSSYITVPISNYQSVDHISHAKYMRRESTHCSITLELAFSIRRVHEVRVWEGDGKDGGLG